MRERTRSGTRPRASQVNPQRRSRRAVREGASPGPGPGRPEHLPRLLQTEIIPRLMLVHRVSPPDKRRDATRSYPDDVSELTRLLLLPHIEPARRFIKNRRAQGLPLEAVFLELLSPSALLVGELWDADLCTFTDVTISLSRLQLFVRELPSTFGAEEALRGPGQVAVFTPAPGEQHVFGLMLVEEFFRRAGWDAVSQPAEKALPFVRRRFVTMIGFSAGDEDRLGPLAMLITKVRAASRNPQLIVLVGGKCFIDRPELVGQVGADATARDAQEAVTVMQRYLEAKAAASQRAEDGTRRWMRPTTRCDLAPPRIHLATSTRRQRPK